MAEERVWQIVLNALAGLDQKIDRLAELVAKSQEGYANVQQRLGEQQSMITKLCDVQVIHGTAIDRHNRQLDNMGRLVWGLLATILGAIALGLLRVLPTIVGP